MPNDFTQLSDNQGSSVPETTSTPVVKNLLSNPEAWQLISFTGQGLDNLSYNNAKKNQESLSVEKLQNLTPQKANKVLAIDELDDYAFLSEWFRNEFIFNGHKLRCLEIQLLVDLFQDLLRKEVEQHQSFATQDELKAFVSSIGEELIGIITDSDKNKLVEEISKASLTLDNATTKLIHNLPRPFNNEEIKEILTTYITNINDNPASPLKQSSAEYQKYFKPKANNAVQVNPVNKFNSMCASARNSTFKKFIEKEIQVASHRDDLHQALMSIFNQGGIIQAPINVFRTILAKNQATYTLGITDEKSKIIFNWSYNEKKFIGETIIPVYEIIEQDDGRSSKYILNLSPDKLETSEFIPDIKQCRPLFTFKLKHSFSPESSAELTRYNILGYDIYVANNKEITQRCEQLSLKTTNFSTLVEQLNSLDASDGNLLNGFVDNWYKYYTSNLPENSKYKTDKKENEIGEDELTDTLRLTIEAFRQNNPKELIVFNRNLGIMLEYLEPQNASLPKFAVLNKLHALVNKNIADIKNQQQDNDNNKLFRKNVIDRISKFRRFSSVIYSILENINHHAGDKDGLYSLTCDFASLALTLEKLNTTKNLHLFKDFLCLERYDDNILKAYKEFIKFTKRTPHSNKEVIEYLEKGVAYFEALVTASNDTKINTPVGKYVNDLKQLSDNYEDFKANIVINHLKKQREFRDYNLEGTDFDKKLMQLEDLLHTEAVEEFRYGKTLKQVAHGEVGQICDKTISFIDITVSKKPASIKQAAATEYKKQTFWLTAKPMIRAAITAVASAAIGFIGIAYVVGAAIKSGFFGFKAKQQINEVSKAGDAFMEQKDEAIEQSKHAVAPST